MKQQLAIALTLAGLVGSAGQVLARAVPKDSQAADSTGPLLAAAGEIARLRKVHALAISQSTASPRDVAESGLALAKALRLNGNYGEALEVLADAGSRVGPDAGLLSDDIEVTRAVLYSELERPEEAEAIYRKLIDLYDSHPGRNPTGRLSIENNLAELIAAQGRVREALPLAREVVAGRSASLGPASPLTLAAKSNLGSYFSKTLDDPDCPVLVPQLR